MPFVRADYVKISDNTVLSEQTNLYRQGNQNNTTIVVKNNVGDAAALIFHKDNVSEIIHPENDPTKIDLLITSPDLLRRALYRFGFPNRSQASSFRDLLN